MFAFIIRRLLLMVPTTIGIALVVFSIYHLAPGDPATVMMGIGSGGQMGTDSDVEAKIDSFRRKHGLDRHAVVQFLDYIGPFNLSRDGHPWFSSPYTEREVLEVELEDGSVAREGKPLAIAYLLSSEDAERNAMDELRFTLTDVAAGEAEWERAAAELVGRGDEGLPPLFTSLFDLRLEPEGRADAVDRVSAALTRSTGYEPAPHDERTASLGRGALIRDWFRWYYEEGGGYRVRNTGESAWGGLLCFELGDEMQAKTPVADELIERLKVTVPLSICAVLLSYLIALPLGILSVRKHGTKFDGFTTVALFVLYSIPTFWAGLMLILLYGETGSWWMVPGTVSLVFGSILFGVIVSVWKRVRGQRPELGVRSRAVLAGQWAGWVASMAFVFLTLRWMYGEEFEHMHLGVLGLHDKDSDSFGSWAYAWDTIKHSFLPVATLTYGSLAYLSRQMRAGMLDVIHQDYIRTAKAKGLSERVVIYKHALRNSMIPVLTLLASILPILIGGSIIVEKVFNIPGMGKYAYEGLLRRDFYIVMATTIFVGIMTQIGILLSDITYSLVDPRIRYD